MAFNADVHWNERTKPQNGSNRARAETSRHPQAIIGPVAPLAKTTTRNIELTLPAAVTRYDHALEMCNCAPRQHAAVRVACRAESLVDLLKL